MQRAYVLLHPLDLWIEDVVPRGCVLTFHAAGILLMRLHQRVVCFA